MFFSCSFRFLASDSFLCRSIPLRLTSFSLILPGFSGLSGFSPNSPNTFQKLTTSDCAAANVGCVSCGNPKLALETESDNYSTSPELASFAHGGRVWRVRSQRKRKEEAEESDKTTREDQEDAKVLQPLLKILQPLFQAFDLSSGFAHLCLPQLESPLSLTKFHFPPLYIVPGAWLVPQPAC